jgi:hypothetical protein
MHTFNLPEDTRQWLETEAQFLGISFNELVVQYLKDAVNDQKKQVKNNNKVAFEIGG